MVQLLNFYDIKIIMVFDGKKLMAKEKTEQLRQKQKEDNKLKGEKYIKDGDELLARKFYSRYDSK